jgi:cyanophycinase
MVIIIDGSKIEQTNITDIKEGDPIFVENLIVHVLAKGSKFSIKERKLINQLTGKRSKILAHE